MSSTVEFTEISKLIYHTTEHNKLMLYQAP